MRTRCKEEEEEVCVFMLVTWCSLRGAQMKEVQMGTIWRCAEWKCGEVEEACFVICGHL